jgi:glycerate kinase
VPDAAAEVFGIADGGEGTLDVFLRLGMEKRSFTVTGPLGEKLEAGCCIGGGRAFIEMAAAAGLPLVPPEKRDPMDTTTRGVGELILGALDCGCREIYLGIGGSATNDCGIGMLTALGFGFYDEAGNKCEPNGRGLCSAARIDGSAADPRLKECAFTVTCDVNNPLFGRMGAAEIYGPQKGAPPEAIRQLDSAAENFARLCGGRENAFIPGAGAAGGLGFAMRQFLGARLIPGIDFILQAAGIEAHIADADLVITGEGRLDAQSAMGKAPAGVAALAAKYGVPAVAVTGCLGIGADECLKRGMDAYFPIPAGPCTEQEAMDADIAAANLSRTAEQVCRLFLSGGRGKR